MQDVEIIETTQVKKGNYKAILGFAGAGFIGNTAVNFVSRSKNFRQIAHIRSPYVFPLTLIVNGNLEPSFRIQFDDANGLFFVITESMIPAEGCWPIARELLNWLKEKGVKELYSLDGLPFTVAPPEIKVLGYGNKIDLSSLGIPPIREGALSGLTSCLMEECVEKGMPFVCLLFPTNKIASIDYSTSVIAVDTLNRLFKFGVDSSPLKMSDVPLRKSTQQRSSKFGNIFKKN